jgi:hypothetical protein
MTRLWMDEFIPVPEVMPSSIQTFQFIWLRTFYPKILLIFCSNKNMDSLLCRFSNALIEKPKSKARFQHVPPHTLWGGLGTAESSFWDPCTHWGPNCMSTNASKDLTSGHSGSIYTTDFVEQYTSGVLPSSRACCSICTNTPLTLNFNPGEHSHMGHSLWMLVLPGF